MNRSQYLADANVREFLDWARPRLSEPGAFIHGYRPARDAPFSCRSVFEAYERYAWPFRVIVPGETLTAGRTFGENQAVLKRLSVALRTTLAAGDNQRFLDAATAVLRWGGVFPRNGATLGGFGDGLTIEFAEAARQLTPESADTERIDRVHLMNAGFTKVYSLLIDGFPIYDGRVGAALGYLARLYCEDAALDATPETLRFAWGMAKGSKRGEPRKNRDPSSGAIRFPGLAANVGRHATCNLMAAWLLGDLSEAGRFGELPPERRMRAIESALFMIGYELPLGVPGTRRRREVGTAPA